MAKFNKRIERMIAELGKDQKMIDMHGVNIAHRNALRERRADLCRLFLAAYRYHKNDRRDVVAYDDRKAKKAAIKEAIYKKYNGSTLKARMLYLVEIMQGKYNEEFKDLLDEACDEIDKEKAEVCAAERVKNLQDLHKWCESKAEKLARVTGEDKAAIVERLEGRTSEQEAERARLVEMCDRFDNADDFMDRVRAKVDILDPFYDLAYEVYSERKDKESDQRLKEAEKALEEAKQAVKRAEELKQQRPTLSLKRAADKRENKILTVGNKKAYQVGKGDWKHRNGVIIDN